MYKRQQPKISQRIAEERKKSEMQGRKQKIYLSECRIPDNSKER